MHPPRCCRPKAGNIVGKDAQYLKYQILHLDAVLNHVHSPSILKRVCPKFILIILLSHLKYKVVQIWPGLICV